MAERTGRLPQGKRRGDKGATMVEMALIAPILFAAIFAVMEFGLAFRDYLSVSHAARDGARAGATYGNDTQADYLILRDIEETLATIGISDGVEVRVFDPTAPANSTSYTYQAGFGSGCDWNPCPDPDRGPGPPYTQPSWNPALRDVDAPFTGRLAVEVSYTHKWVTGFFLQTTDFTSEADFQIEPQVFGS